MGPRVREPDRSTSGIMPDLDPIERHALAFIVRELETGRTHVCTDTFLPFLQSHGAGDRLVAILTYFTELGILTPASQPRMPLLARGVISAYWGIEGRAREPVS